jgi:hypothetical protein
MSWFEKLRWERCIDRCQILCWELFFMYIWKIRLSLKISDRRVSINELLLFLEERLIIETFKLNNYKNESTQAFRLSSHENQSRDIWTE